LFNYNKEIEIEKMNLSYLITANMIQNRKFFWRDP